MAHIYWLKSWVAPYSKATLWVRHCTVRSFCQISLASDGEDRPTIWFWCRSIAALTLVHEIYMQALAWGRASDQRINSIVCDFPISFNLLLGCLQNKSRYRDMRSLCWSSEGGRAGPFTIGWTLTRVSSLRASLTAIRIITLGILS